MIACTSKRCIFGFQDLLNSMESHRSGHSMERITSYNRLSEFESEVEKEDPVDKENSATVEDVSESVVAQAPIAKAIPTEATLQKRPPEAIENKLRALGNKPGLGGQDPQVSDAQADQLHKHLVKRMDEFNNHLMRWSQMVENQVVQLTQSFDSLKTFGEQIQFPQSQGGAPLSSAPPAGGGLPGQQAKGGAAAPAAG
mmetsp:Transcript_5006/g.7176  ORF Transcript_5006/g.7176 Transcript_5006/m.7176 type:complete len:198 (+) Transcript_5006:1-594(+)